MAGRVLRKHPDEPVKQIVQSVGTKWPFGRTAAPANQFVWSAGEWRSLEANPLINQVSMRVMKALARTNVELPKFVTQRSGWLRRREKYETSED